MKSLDEIQKLKVAELKQELQSRGLDTKGVKAILVDRLLDALEKEGGEAGNGSVLIPPISADSFEEADGGMPIPEATPVQEESSKRITRGQSASPVKNTTVVSKALVTQPLPDITVHDSPVVGEFDKKLPTTSTDHGEDTIRVKPAVSMSDEASVSVTFSTNESPKPAEQATLSTDSTSLGTVPSTTITVIEKESLSINPSPEDPLCEAPTHGEKSNVEVKEDSSREDPLIETVEMKEVDQSRAGVNDQEPGEAAQSCDYKDVTDVNVVYATIRGVADHVDQVNEESMESGNTDDNLKRKLEGEDGSNNGIGVVKKTRIDREVRVSAEDEPEFDDQKILLDWYNSDLNIGISKEDFLTATPLIFDDFPWAYAGAKATHGFTGGKLTFEVKWLESLSVSLDLGQLETTHTIRVGWSDLYANLQLGDGNVSYAYGSDGKFHNAGIVQDLEEATCKQGDVISTFLDLDSDPSEIKFAINGKELVKSIQMQRADIEGKILFPHILSRNVAFEVNFGDTEPAHSLLENFDFVAKIPSCRLSSRIRGPIGPKHKGECEFVMLCGMACCGKTTWAEAEKSRKLDKHFNIIGTSSVIARAVKPATLSGDNIPRLYESFHMKAGRFVEKLMEIAPTRRRNYILDQSNVVTLVQRRKAAGFEGFKRRAVVILPNDEEYQKRIQAREQEQGKSVPKSTLLDMKATFRLPEVGDVFSEVEFAELTKEECEELLKKYNKEASDAGYYGQKPSRGGGNWHGQGAFRGSRGFRGPGGFRGPRRGFRGGPPPFRFIRDSRPPRYSGPPRVPRDFTHRAYGSSRGGRGAAVPMPLIPRRTEVPRSAWIRGMPPMNGRGGAAPAPRPYQNYSTRQQYSGVGMRSTSHAGVPFGSQRPPQQSIWTSGQPGGGWGTASGRGGYHAQQQQQHADPWIQQVPDQGFGQSWGASARGGTNVSGGGTGTWQGYGGQTYGSYGRK